MLIRTSKIALLGFLAAATSCTSISSNYTGAITKAHATRIYVCHGYDCSYKTRLDLTEADQKKFAAIMSGGASSPEAERAAISKAAQYYEERAAKLIGVRDEPQSTFGAARVKGQMDCIDESTNTRSLLLHLAARGLLKHHKVGRNVSRGILIDGRYPHSTAVISDPSGRNWVVDSWYEPGGGAPDIMPLEVWLTRGGGVR